MHGGNDLKLMTRKIHRANVCTKKEMTEATKGRMVGCMTEGLLQLKTVISLGL